MKRSSLVLTALAIAGLLVSACDSPTATDDWTVTPPSFAGATVTTVPFTDSGTIPCTGEYVELVGEFQRVNHLRSDGSGVFHVTDNWNIKGVGTGSFGNTYQYSHTGPFGVNDVAGAPSHTFTVADNVRVVSRGDAPNWILHYTIHTTIDNNGVVTADFFKFAITCK